jgi:hypothetical protein
MAVSTASPRTYANRSGGPVGRPAASTHTITVLPVRPSGGAGTMPVRCIPSGAAHLACAVARYPPYPESWAAASNTAGTWCQAAR